MSHSNVITSKDEAEKVQIRSNLFCMHNISKWVRQFGEDTNTELNFRSSKPNGSKIVLQVSRNNITLLQYQ